MSGYTVGDWVQYRTAEGYTREKKVLEIRPDGCLVLGDHDHDSDNPIIDPDHKESLKRL